MNQEQKDHINAKISEALSASLGKREKYYAVYVCEQEKYGERMVWYALKSDIGGRVYFFSGSGIIPCIFTTWQGAHAEIKKMRQDFDDGSQFYVRPIVFFPQEKEKRESEIKSALETIDGD